MSESTEITTEVSKDLLAEAAGNMPTDSSFQRIILPRIGLHTKDETEGKGKAMVVTEEAGTYYIESESEETNDAGKKVWKKTAIGKEFEATVIYYRKKLTLYDSKEKKYTNSPIYDNDTDIVPLFKDKREIARGTPAELKNRKEYVYKDERTGKTKSHLDDMKVLYILYKGNIYQSEIKRSSMWAFNAYTRGVVPPVVLTHFSSEYKDSGSVEWNQMAFKTLRKLTSEEVVEVVGLQNMIKSSIKAEKDYFASLNTDVPSESSSMLDPNEVAGDLVLPEVKVQVLGDGHEV